MAALWLLHNKLYLALCRSLSQHFLYLLCNISCGLLVAVPYRIYRRLRCTNEKIYLDYLLVLKMTYTVPLVLHCFSADRPFSSWWILAGCEEIQPASVSGFRDQKPNLCRTEGPVIIFCVKEKDKRILRLHLVPLSHRFSAPLFSWSASE